MIDDTSLEKLATHLRDAGENKFTGSIQINFYKGGITNIVKESVRKEVLNIGSHAVQTVGYVVIR